MKRLQTQQGQTIIETMVAILILSMGLGAAASLANYAFNASSNIVKQVVGMGLAREGVEMIKNMRDTNWLQDNLSSSCYNYQTLASDGACYPNWLSGYYNLDPAAGNGGNGGSTYAVGLTNSLTPTAFSIGNESTNYSLSFTASGTPHGYYYSAPLSSSSGTSSGYYRRITLSTDSPGPFSADTAYSRVLVTSEVWWTGKRCPAVSATAPPTSGNCKIRLQMYLTNWKNY